MLRLTALFAGADELVEVKPAVNQSAAVQYVAKGQEQASGAL
jgi:hypothetical protein